MNEMDATQNIIDSLRIDVHHWRQRAELWKSRATALIPYTSHKCIDPWNCGCELNELIAEIREAK